MPEAPPEQQRVDAAFAVLARPRRRYVLRALQDYRNPMALADLAQEVAGQENGTPPTDISPDEIERVSHSLYHIHLPKLVDEEFVHYDRERNFVSLEDCSDHLEQYQDLLSIE